MSLEMVLGVPSAVWLLHVSWRELALLRRLKQALSDKTFVLTEHVPVSSDAGLVSLVIPARNEEHNIADCVKAALAQDYPSLEVIVVDDGSDDRTGEILSGFSNPRLRVISGGKEGPPEGWLGKPWACHRASQVARGEWLLFIDADVRLSPGAVSLSVSYAHQHQIGLLTGFGSELAVSVAEKILHSFIFFRFAAETDWTTVNNPSYPGQARGNGRFMLFREKDYTHIGGHASVRKCVLEDEALARRVKRLGLRYRFLFIAGLYRCRMYRSARELWAGWRRSLYQGLRGLSDNVGPVAPGALWLRFTVVLGHLGFRTVMPYVVIAMALGGVAPLWLGLLAAVPVCVRQVNRFRFDRVVGFDAVTSALTHTLGNLLFVVLVIDGFRSGLLGINQWKGRLLPR